MEVATVWHSRATFINGSRYYLVHRPRVRISGPAWHPAPTITWTTKTRRSTVLAGILAYQMAPGTVSLNSTYLHHFGKNLVFLKRNGKRSLVRILSALRIEIWIFDQIWDDCLCTICHLRRRRRLRRSSDVMFYARSSKRANKLTADWIYITPTEIPSRGNNDVTLFALPLYTHVVISPASCV